MSKSLIVGILCAVPAEYHRAREILQMKELDTTTTGFRRAAREGQGGRWDLLMTGLGKGHPLPQEARSWDLLIDTGSCGALDQGLEPPSGILSFSSRIEDSLYKSPLDHGAREILRSAFPEYKEKEILTVENPLLSASLRDRLFGRWKSPVCTMETAFHFSAALELGIPFFSLRIITDRADQSASEDFKTTVKGAMNALYRDLKEFLVKNNKELLMIDQ